MKSLCLRIFLPILLGGSAAAAPSLQSVIPDYNAENVAVTSTVTFRFSTEMNPVFLQDNPLIPQLVGSLRWSSNINPFLFDFVWNDAGTELTFTYQENLPAEATITWTWNPDNTIFPLTDLSGQPLPQTSGSFTTGTGGGGGCDPGELPEDFGSVNLFKFIPFVQSGDAAPVLDPELSPGFSANVLSPTANAVTTASLSVGGGADQALTGLFGSFFLGEEFATPEALESAYPSGSYEITLQRDSGGPTVVSMNMPGEGSYPPTPQVSNYASLQGVDPTQPLTINWNGIAGVGNMDRIAIEILDAGENVIYSAPDECIPIELPNTATSVTLPADLLQEGGTYTGVLYFSHFFSFQENDPANFNTFGAISIQTRFTITTVGVGGGDPPTIVADSGEILGGLMQFDVTDLSVGQPYTIEYNNIASPLGWSTLMVTNPASSSIQIIDPTPVTGNRFYRVKAGE